MKAKWKTGIGLLIVVASVVTGYAVFSSNGKKLIAKTDIYPHKIAKSERRVPVVLTPVSLRNFEERLVVQGNLEAQNVAMVPARVDATIEKIFVDEGDPVIAGKTKLFQIDSLKLQKAVEVSRQALAVAKCAVSEKKANLERVEAELYKATIDYERFEKLLKKRIVSADEFERIESGFKQSAALRKYAQTLIDLAVEQQRQAEVALEMAEKDLRDALVYAPISGTVSKRFQEPGEMGDTKEPVLRIEDTSVVEVSAFFPAQFYARIHPGKTPAELTVCDVDIGRHTVSYKSPTIDPKLRTFEIKSLLKDPPECVVPGSMVTISVVLEQRKGLGVPAEAIQKRSGKSIVFVIQNGVARSIEIQKGLETDGYVELKGNSMPQGTPVVTRGQVFLTQGTPVTLTEEGS